MIYDVMATLETEAEDGSTGLDQRITDFNSDKSETVPSLGTILVYGPTDGSTAKLPGEYAEADFPLFAFRPGPSQSELQQQGKRRGTHEIEVLYMDHEPDQNEARKHMAAMQTIVMRWLEGVVGTGTIAEIQRVRWQDPEWLTAGRGMDVGRVRMTFQVVERDENP